MGKIPRLGTLITDIIDDEQELYRIVDRALQYYQKNGRKKERFGHMLDRIGIDTAKKEIIHG